MFKGFRSVAGAILILCVFFASSVLRAENDPPQPAPKGSCLYQIRQFANPDNPEKQNIEINVKVLFPKPLDTFQATRPPSSAEYPHNSYIVGVWPHLLIETHIPPDGDLDIDGTIHVQSLVDPKGRAVLPIPHDIFKSGATHTSTIYYPTEIPLSIRERIQTLLNLLAPAYAQIYWVAEPSKFPHQIMESRKEFLLRTEQLGLTVNEEWQRKTKPGRLNWDHILQYWQKTSKSDPISLTTAFRELMERLVVGNAESPSDKVQIWFSQSEKIEDPAQWRDEFTIEFNTLDQVTFQVVFIGIHR